MSDNLVKDYLEESEAISSEQFLDYIMLSGDRWDIYKESDDTLTFIRYELTGKIGYAFSVRFTCKRMTIDIESFYYVKSYGNAIKESWDCERSAIDPLLSHAISILKPY